MLADAAQARPEEPWLFFRNGLDWRWRSYALVADQVARGALSLNDWAATQHSETAAIHTSPAMEPADRIAAILAIQASGRVTGWPGSEAGGEQIGPLSGQLTLPPSRGPLERFAPESLLPAPAIGGFTVSGPHGDDSWSSQDVVAAARALISEEDRARSSRVARPILFVHPDLLAASNRSGPSDDRAAFEGGEAQPSGALPFPQAPSVSQAPWTVLVLGIVTAISLELDAAWILEPQTDAFIPTLLWIRPTLVITTFDGVEDLCAAFSAPDGKRHRKHSRLVRVMVCMPKDPGASIRRRWAEQLGVTVDLWRLGDGA